MAEKNRTNSRAAKKNRVRLAIRKKVEDYLEHLQSQGLPIQSAYIFGSQVGGRTNKWSDIDLCVISKNFGPRNDGITYLWRQLRKQDVQAGIEPIGFHPKEFTDDIPLVWEILRQGVRIV